MLQCNSPSERSGRARWRAPPAGSWAAFEVVSGSLKMKSRMMWAATCLLGVAAFAGQASPSLAQSGGVVTVYSADGLHDGTPSWFGNQFDAFTKATGIKVQYVEAGSGGVVERSPRRSPTRRPTCSSPCRPSSRRRRRTAYSSRTRRPAPTRSRRATRTQGHVRRAGQQLHEFHLQRFGR